MSNRRIKMCENAEYIVILREDDLKKKSNNSWGQLHEKFKSSEFQFYITGQGFVRINLSSCVQSIENYTAIDSLMFMLKWAIVVFHSISGQTSDPKRDHVTAWCACRITANHIRACGAGYT